MRPASRFLLIAALLALPFPAQAGFEMRGSGAAGGGEVIRPSEAGDMPAHKVGAVEAAPVGAISADLAPIDAPIPLTDAQIKTAPMEIAADMGGDASVVNGFGSDLPLAIALQQIVPAGHQVSFAPEVDVGEIVSWQGGQPWPAVASTMLGSVGMTYDIKDGHVVHIRKSDVHQMPSAQAILAEGAPPAPYTVPATYVSAALPAPVALAAPPAPPALPAVAAAPATYVSATPSAPVVSAAPPAAQTETAEIRRTKPSRLWDRMQTRLKSSFETDLIVDRAPSDSVAAATPVVPQGWKDASTAAATEFSAEMAPVTAQAVDDVGGNWHVSEGDSLSAVLARWSEQEGVQFRWQPSYDYKLKKSAAFGGDYASAVTRLLDEFAELNPRPTAQLYANAAHPRVLVVR